MARRNPPVRIHRGHRSLDHIEEPALEVDIATAVREINRIYVTGGLRTVVAIGRYILDTFFEGDPVQFSGRGAPGWRSFRELYGRNDLAMSRSFLSSSVQVMLQVEQLPGALAGQLNATQHRALLPVKDPEAKITLAREAVDESLSSRDLRRRVWDHLGPGSRPDGRKPFSPPEKAIRLLERSSRSLAREVKAGGAWERLPGDERSQLLERVDRSMRRLERTRRRAVEAEGDV